ncbi:alpha/beta hydrolase [Sphingopyxis sp. MSC1_008]|uniref:alpha/beta hydrolase n=1 Tax=Sphingopyxis sp. MSC1_008 TaxID=2909265 RepID=UPI0020BD4E73|nr:alpha/beta hydrolase [Sphingopyxis sp. MSC1_008]
MKNGKMVRASLAMMIATAFASQAVSQQTPSGERAAPQQKPSAVDEAGTLRLPAGDEIPYSDLASAEARKNFVDATRGFEAVLAKPSDWKPKKGESEAQAERRWYDEILYIPWLARVRQQYAVDVEAKTIAGVQTDVIVPRAGLSPDNQNRVLINLHGGGMIAGARYGGQLESIPIASIGRIKVVTVDYRMAPEHHYPAAEEDVIAVYRELLKTHRPENIGIYGCSAGAWLTGTTVAKLIAAGEPRPGAIGMFGLGPFGSPRVGDSNYMFSGGKPVIPAEQAFEGNYAPGLNWKDGALYPVEVPAVQRRFPPSLLISGTRDIGLSRTVFSHSLLVERGVEAELHVFEGAPHCAFAQPFVDPAVPESRQAWNIIVKFFDRHLGR